MTATTDAGDDRIEPPSRAEIETLCLVYLARGTGCSLGDMAEGLGLSRDLARVLEDAISPLMAAGRLEERDGIILATEAGKSWLRDRLSKLGVL